MTGKLVSYRTIKKYNILSFSVKDKMSKVVFPQFSTLVPPFIKSIPPVTKLDVSPQQNFLSQNSLPFYVDYERKVLVINSGQINKEYTLDQISNFNSKTGKSLDKNEAIELANSFLKLNIKTSSKKKVFIEAIRKKIGLPDEI